jgi:hypothetical protein
MQRPDLSFGGSRVPGSKTGIWAELTVQDLKAKLEKLRIEAEDCEFIGMLATDSHKRALFLKLAVDLRAMARDIETVIATRPIPKETS